MKEKEHQTRALMLETVLESFKVKGKVLKANEGPVITQYEYEPELGIKSSKVIGLADDIARAMSVVTCRASVIPGTNVIGIEVPNKKRAVVKLDTLFNTPLFKKGKEALPWALGVDIGGETVMVDIAKFPHLLMAGTTGSGKSVAMNTLIVSLLKRLSPDECKFIMIDPKQLELAVYADIPHLLAPVVTDPTEAVEALQWAVSEMEDRYQKMSEIGVRNIAGYNEDSDEKLPYIVVIIDEVADLMMVAGKEVEKAVARLAQMARAAGIHVVMATQRPSIDVITGTVKANFPTRISFQVVSKFDSRTILGIQGAEQLLGMGDMLFMRGGSKMRRIHGAFMSDDEVAGFVEKVKQTGKPEYAPAFVQEVADQPENREPDLYEQAVAVIMADQTGTASHIQRSLGISYLEAQKLMERAQADNFVGPSDLGGRRKVLIPFHD